MMNIQITENESREWVLVEKNNKVVYAGHSIPNWVFYDLIIELGGKVETTTITDEEMEERGY